MPGTSNSDPISSGLQRIAELARQDPDRVLTSLAHHIDLDWLHAAYLRTRKDGAPGVDGQTAAEYAAHLEENLQSLLDRAKSGTYRAPPVRRVYIPKGDGQSQRPLGIPTFEDKVLQRAVAMVLEAVYEQDFLDCSYGFRPGRSAHQALGALRKELTTRSGGWVLEVDIRKFFDTLGHSQLREILQRRVRDGVLLRLIGKWLNAGVLEEGTLSHPESGTPQGGVISPILANVYLHEVLDVWFTEVVRPRLRGRATLIRYADDFVIVFDHEEDARRVLAVLPKRFGKYGLALHPDKTRLVAFHRPRSLPSRRGTAASEKPGTFDLLGFTLHWAQSRKGTWVVMQKTARSRFTRALKKIAQWCRVNRHKPIPVQHRILVQKLRGHIGYYGYRGNSKALYSFRRETMRTWRKWLDRRSQRAHMTWDRFNRLLERFPFPNATPIHSLFPPVANP